MNNPLFPRNEVEQKLRSWWKRKTESPLSRKRTNPRQTGGTVFDIQPEVSSAETVEVFLEVEPLLGFKLKSSGLVKLGGYQSCNEFIQHFLPRLEAKFDETNPVTKKAVVKSLESLEGMRPHAS